MTRAVVIRSIGDRDIADAIVDGMTQRVIPLDEGQLEAVTTELELYKARLAVRIQGDYRRTQRARRERLKAYSAKPVSGAHGVILTAWGMLCMGVYTLRDGLRWR